MATFSAMLAFGQAPSIGVEIPGPAQATLAASSPPSVGTTVQTSLTAGGALAPHGASNSMISGDGHWQVFVSNDNLTSVANAGSSNVYIRNVDTGALSQVSVTSTGTSPNGFSTQPSVSNDGNLVSFITTATDIATGTAAGGSSLSLVVCNRAAAGGQACFVQYTTLSNSGSALDTGVRPQLAGIGNTILWMQHTPSGGPFAGPSIIRVGTVHLAAAPPTATDVHTVDGGLPATAGFSNPTMNEFGHQVVFVAVTSSAAGTVVRLMRSSLAGDNTTNTSTRIDVDPDDPTKFAGDPQPNLDVSIDHPTVSQFGDTVAFHFQLSNPPIILFGPHVAAAVPNTEVSWELVVSGIGSIQPTSEVVSVNNAGTRVDGEDGAISADGRYVAFVTNATNAHDGVDGSAGTRQIVVRDLQSSTLRGALATPTANTPCSPKCTASANTFAYGAISLDNIGSRVGFDSRAIDLVTTPADTNNAFDTFVRTWTPALSSGTSDFGPVQIGTSIVRNVPITLSGFGPLTLPSLATDLAHLSPSGGDFAVTGADCFFSASTLITFAMHDGDSCSVAIQFTPDPSLTTDTVRTATLSIKADQYPAAQQVGTVQGLATVNCPRVAPGDTTRGSVDNGGAEAALGGSESMISGNGRWQVFVSRTELAGRTTLDGQQVGNVFVRDLADPQHTVQISLHTDVDAQTQPTDPSRPIAVSGQPRGASPNDDSSQPSISSDGRFVSFFTQATDIVPRPALNPPDAIDYVLVVCDRDPTGAKDAKGNPILDRPRKGTNVPNYVCFPVESGAFATDSAGADTSSTPKLSGDGTRITWGEDIDFSEDRVLVATLSTPGGKLHAPSDVAYVPSTVAGFLDPGGANRGTGADQDDPVLTEDGNSVVFDATNCTSSPCRVAVIKTDLTTGTSVRVDTTDNGSSFLGDTGGFFDPPATSADGTRIAFAYDEPGQTPSLVYVATLSGGTIQTVISSRDNRGNPAAGYLPALSGDGRYLAFETDDSNMHDGVDNLGGPCFESDFVSSAPSAAIFCQVVARDLVKDAALNPPATWTPSELVSSSLTDDCMPPGRPLPPGRTCAGDNNSTNPSIDATGSEIGFDSVADDLIASDTNKSSDAFVHTWRPVLSAPAFAFGAVALGAHKDRTFTLTESGFGPISLGATSINGIDAADFALLGSTCAGATLNDTQSCSLKLRFTPAATGNRTATISTAVGKNGFPRHNPDNTVSYDPALLATLTGFGTNVAVVVDPATLDFGKQLPERHPGVTKTVTVTNTGNKPLGISGVSVLDTTQPGAAGDYTVDASDCVGTTVPGASCTISVTFVGHRVGKRDASLVITDNDPGGPTTITLLATVPKPKVLANPGVAVPGRVTIVSGAGFAPHLQVDVTLKGSNEMVTAVADAKGRFEVGLVIFKQSTPGPREVSAHTHGKSPTISADGPLLLQLGSIDVLQLVTRH